MKKKSSLKLEMEPVFHIFIVKFIQDKKVMKEIQVHAITVREATAIAMNVVGHLIYWNEIKVEML